MIQYEEMSLNAWPAIRNAVFKGCLIRSSNGYTNRANSANPLYTERHDSESVVRYCEDFFTRQGLPSVFKILSGDRYAEIDRFLDERKYEKITETAVMGVDLDAVDKTDGVGVVVEKSFSREWCDSAFRFNRVKDEYAETARTMLGLIAVPVIVASIVENGKIVACGYGALENGYVGFFDIVVDGDYRGKGHGRMLMNGIIAEARRHGAKRGYLQVMNDNEIAKALYISLGFEKLYSYWYRRKR